MKYWIFASLSLIICRVFAQQSFNNDEFGKQLLFLEQHYFESETDSEKYIFGKEKLSILLVANKFESAMRELKRLENLHCDSLRNNNYLTDVSLLCFINKWFEGCLHILESDTITIQSFFLKTLCFLVETMVLDLI